MQDNHPSRDRDTKTRKLTDLQDARFAKLHCLADDHALVLALELDPHGLGYVLRDHWTGVRDFGPATIAEIEQHLRRYQNTRERELAEGWTP